MGGGVETYFSFQLKPSGLTTRMELPSCEAIDVKKVNIGNIVIPITKFKAGINQRLLLTSIQLKLVPRLKLVLTSKWVPTSKPTLI